LTSIGKALPAARLLLIGEIALQAGRHVGLLEPHERRRLAVLVALGARRRGSLSVAERAELARLLMKLQPRAFFGAAVRRVSPIPLPRRILEGKRR
jgi:hypothetical protein